MAQQAEALRRRREPAALLDFQAQRKASSRERLLAAASVMSGEPVNLDVTAGEIGASTGVSQGPFNPHFTGKADLATALFHLGTQTGRPLVLAIRERDYGDFAVVRAWIAELFSSDRRQRQLLRAFIQANAAEDEFTAVGHAFLTGVVAELGQSIPAFAADPANPQQRRQWGGGWVLIYEILDLGNHSARDSGVACLPETIDILADRFMMFTRRFAA